MIDDPTTPDLIARQGASMDASDPDRLRRAVELAFDYRGDVTVTRRSTGDAITGYLFDRTAGPTTESSVIRVMRADDGQRITVPYDDIAEIGFSGRDPAEGKSFDTWMRNYVQKKLAGEEASIESEPLDP